MFARIWALIGKEFIQVVRDRRTLAMALVMPIMQLILFGYAVNTTVDHIATIVVDQSMDVRSRDFIHSIANTGYFDIVGSAEHAGAARRAIDTGTAKVAFIFPPDFGRESLAGRSAQVQVLIDGSDPNTATTALLSAEALARVRGIELLGATMGRTPTMPIDNRPTVLYNPSLRSVNFMVPGLIGMILQTQAVMLTAFAIVRERERGTLEQLIVTPIRPFELMAGKIIPYVIIAFAQIGVALIVGRFWFQVPFNGDLGLLLALSLLFLLGALGMGMMISTVSRTQAQAMQATLFTLLPSIIISGFMFPREAMPPVIASLSYVLPLTYYLQILRGTIVKGVGLDLLWPQVIPLLVFAVVISVLSTVRFRRSLA
ncbi:MAG: ABC transporter permease [Chloroflexota bacterium]|nr:MAG: ABC transporter permease [Chloroflexota bacterium]